MAILEDRLDLLLDQLSGDPLKLRQKNKRRRQLSTIMSHIKSNSNIGGGYDTILLAEVQKEIGKLIDKSKLPK